VAWLGRTVGCAAQHGYIQYRDPAEPLDNAPIAAEDTVTGQRYLYMPAPAMH
jgi:hypothetical protein